MKKKICFLLSLLLCLTLCAMPAWAKTQSGTLKLPEDDGSGYPLTGISGQAYCYNEEVTCVEVPENILRLDDRVFYGCANLAQITLPDTLQRIGRQAFEGTAYYENAENWENGVLYIGSCLIKADPAVIGKQYTVRPGTRLIADGAFEYCTALAQITLPTSLQYVGKDAFQGTAFAQDPANRVDGALLLGSVLLDFDSRRTGEYTLPEGIVTVADGAFADASVEQLRLSDTVQVLGQNALAGCGSLRSLHLGKAVKTIGRGPFCGCKALKTVTVSGENRCFTVVDGILYNKQLTEVIGCPRQYRGRAVLHAGVRQIDAYAFEGCTGLTGVEIPEDCVFIGNAAFSDCEALTELRLPLGLEYIDTCAFSYCVALKTIAVPDSVTYVGPSAFAFCTSLAEASTGNGLSRLTEGVFRGCRQLARLTLGNAVQSIHAAALEDTAYLTDAANYQDGLLIAQDRYLIRVSPEVVHCRIPDGVQYIAEGAFAVPAGEKSLLADIRLPDSLLRLSSGAFDGVKDGTPVCYSGFLRQLLRILASRLPKLSYYTADFTVGVAAVALSVLVLAGFVLAAPRGKATGIETAFEERKHSRLTLWLAVLAVAAFLVCGVRNDWLMYDYVRDKFTDASYHSAIQKLAVTGDLLLLVSFLALLIFAVMAHKMPRLDCRLPVAVLFALSLIQMAAHFFGNSTSFSLFSCAFLAVGRTTALLLLAARLAVLASLSPKVPVSPRFALRSYAAVCFFYHAFALYGYIRFPYSYRDELLWLWPGLFYYAALYFFAEVFAPRAKVKEDKLVLPGRLGRRLMSFLGFDENGNDISGGPEEPDDPDDPLYREEPAQPLKAEGCPVPDAGQSGEEQPE